MCEQDAKALRVKTMQFGFPAPMLTTPLNGRVSELFQLDTNAIVSFGGGRGRKGSTCLLAGFSTGVPAAVHMATSSLRASMCTQWGIIHKTCEFGEIAMFVYVHA